MSRTLTCIAAVALFGAAHGVGYAQTFYATNNLSSANFGTPGDELIVMDFATAAWTPVGVVTSGGSGIDGIGGLDWNGPVGSTLIGAVSFGANAPAVYSINPTNAQATFIGNSPVPMHDLAFRYRDNKMYGTDSFDGLWVDNTADGVPETFVGSYGIGALEVGLAFDGNGDILVHDLITDTIYKGAGANPASVVPWVSIPFDTNFSQGLYATGDKGYHGALNTSTFLSENWSFSTVNPAGNAGYSFNSAFPTAGTGLPEVEVGDLTGYVVPEPGAFVMLGLGAALLACHGLRRRRTA